ncbi:hypothetical protein NsoK4_00945 [Nitrosopumilus sp. K4]|uniref:hypothetical protein n=1 Tax=Nitrosopumilus sp. K4 TaxID=2795383 RepID=UPI001BADDF52|nr:hypothetical protein [Nitrosopumilus sp. K4]QUC64882.1 hypothetical protein NsoK4_00945 [Nitrosopumilus sp. K4]
MVKPIVLAIGAIPAIIAILIAVPLVTKPDIPFSASTPNDVLDIEYTKHQLKKVSRGVTDRLVSEKTEILEIKNNGEMLYTLTEAGYPNPSIKSKLNEDTHKKIKALIKETGFMAIPSESFPILENVTEYQKSNVKIILNNQVTQIHWPEQNATEKFVPPIITMIELELDKIMDQVSE